MVLLQTLLTSRVVQERPNTASQAVLRCYEQQFVRLMSA
jgi:hypothetical protein